MKILIADDEMLVRIGIKTCIDFEKYGMEVVAEAEDGIQALAQIHAACPDVVILDIKMPKMGGLEVMEKINEEHLQCSVIILSSFDDFEHVKKAMKLGAVDYLHKPRMNAEDILGVLQNVKNTLDKRCQVEEKKTVQKGISRESQNILRNAFLKELLEGEYTTKEEYLKRCAQNNMRLSELEVACIAISVKDYKKVLLRYEKSKQNILQTSVISIMEQILSTENGVAFLPLDENVYVVIMSAIDTSSRKKIMDQISNIIQLLTDAMKTFLNIQIVLGISDVLPTFKDIAKTYAQAHFALKQRFYIDQQVLYYYQVKHKSLEVVFESVDESMKKLKSSILSYRYDLFEKELESFVAFIKEVRLNEEEVKRLFDGLLFWMKEGPAYFEERDIIQEAETIEELYLAYKAIIDERLYKNAGEQIKRCSALTKKLIRYIGEHYSDEMTLKCLAEYLNVSPNYISRLFKEEMGRGLFEYINEYRVKQASQMLACSDDKVYEIADQVGFKSAVHFNIVFNKYMGVSPKQYRDHIQTK